MLLSDIRSFNKTENLQIFQRLLRLNTAKVKENLADGSTLVRDFALNRARNRDLSASIPRGDKVWHRVASGTPSRDRLYMRTVDARRPPPLMAALCFDGRLNNLPLNRA